MDEAELIAIVGKRLFRVRLVAQELLLVGILVVSGVVERKALITFPRDQRQHASQRNVRGMLSNLSDVFGNHIEGFVQLLFAYSRFLLAVLFVLPFEAGPKNAYSGESGLL